MCGIFGVVGARGLAIDPLTVARATRKMRHRGPDDEGYAFFSGDREVFACGSSDTVPELDLPDVSAATQRPWTAAFGFRRLSILDLSPAGHQPMADPSGRYWIVFNGEVYNYLELRGELEALGHAFKTHSDTEVLLAAYAEWGAGALDRFIGMFALAIVDRQEERLFVARDQFGIKPLYFAAADGGFAFASEIKALLELPWVERTADPEALHVYLALGHTDRDERTFFRAVRQLKPGHYIDISIADPQPGEPTRYWQLGEPDRLDLSFDEAAAALRDLVLESIALHMRSDVPVAACLSGGIDSSSIVSAMARTDAEVHAFSYIAEDENGPLEEDFIDLTSERAGATLHKLHLGPEDLEQGIDHFLYCQEQPVRGMGSFAHHRVFQMVQEAGIKVTLDGQGVDEMMAGYDNYLPTRVASLLRQRRPAEAMRFALAARKRPGTSDWKLLQGLFERACPGWLRRSAWSVQRRLLAPDYVNRSWLNERDVGAVDIGGRDGGDEALKAHLRYSLLVGTLPRLLRGEDRNSMAFSIESRVPFITPAIARFVFALPEEYLIAPDGTNKAVLRAAMRGVVPDPILDNPRKIGFGVPEKMWLRTLSPWITSVLESDAASNMPLLDIASIRAAYDSMRQGRRPFDFRRVWFWVSLIRWSEQYDVRFD